MRHKSVQFVLILLLMTINTFSVSGREDKPVIYKVKKAKSATTINANWYKEAWKNISEIAINNYMGDIPLFEPVVKAKMMYDDTNLYLIYKVDDRHVRIQVDQLNGPVSQDACVEFFFSPDHEKPLNYFNLEINAGGTPLMAYHPENQRINMTDEDLRSIEIAHSLPEKLDGEISKAVTWFLEFKIPLALVKKYAKVSHPSKGVTWKANFYKISSASTNPHYITWSVVDHPRPKFHLPQFFGTLNFR